MDDYEKLVQKIPIIEERIGYQFKDKKKLILAFIHSSFVNENKEIASESNERLEFLGDAVLGLLIAEHLFHDLPLQTEGELSRLRSKLIESPSCARFLKSLELSEMTLMGRGEKKNSLSQPNSSILADLFEALIGAVYLDGGIAAAKTFLFGNLLDEMIAITDSPIRNWKAELQDYSQKKYQKIPVYKVMSESGPDHSKTFQITVFIDDRIMGSGYGASKKSAQQAAACDALCQLNISK